MGLFAKLFGKNKFEVGARSSGFTIDIRGDCFIINGKRLDVPIHIDGLSDVLGKPRKTAFKTDAEDKEIYEKIHPGEVLVQRVNYTWDDLGLMCYTGNGSVVNCFGICMNSTDYNVASNPKQLFGGKVLICGKPWLGEVLKGKDCDVFRELIVGNYLLTAEYTDFDQDDDTRDESSFTGIEIQLSDSIAEL